MTTYVLLNGNQIAEIFAPVLDEKGNEVPISDRFHPDFVAGLIDVASASPQPELGWVTADGGKTFAPFQPPVQTAAQIAAAKVAVVQAFMDARAQSLNYDDIATAVTYADEPAVPKFQAEGQAFRAWRSLVWEKCYEILDAVNAGTQSIPSDQDLIAALPAISLPVAA